MYISALLGLETYQPEQYAKDMLFKIVVDEGSKFETTTLIPLGKLIEGSLITQDDVNKVIAAHGYPVKSYVMSLSTGDIIATSDKIGWWDEGDHTDELYDVTLRELNGIINRFNWEIGIEVEDDNPEKPVEYAGKVILTYPPEEEYEMEDEESYTQEQVWYQGKVILSAPIDEDTIEHVVEFNDDFYLIETNLSNGLLYPEDIALLKNENYEPF